MTVDELVFKIAKQTKLTYKERENLLHDINNLRGDEWLDIVEEDCTKEIIKAFKKVIKAEF